MLVTSLDYREIKIHRHRHCMTLHPKESCELTDIAAPRSLRFPIKMGLLLAIAEKEQVRETNIDDPSLKISSAKMAGKELNRCTAVAF
ncbi:hypothetical protein DY000_02011092 [Brassica cretica]|uniref:Uncharacterized protein n=1 Tax=Brassica cretica TaxID=69181 RepID=A0ABQ7CPB3_BRACR|nr:hypothetical protein DY000_02011092 [Brassica cretica]